MHRRQILKSALAAPLVGALPSLVSADDESPLIYLSPIKSNGELSKCQAEVWYVGEGDDYYVVTGADAWRAKAVEQGLHRAQVWVGDVGIWTSANGKWRSLPSVMTQVRFEQDAVRQAQLLEAFGRKYSAEWGTWGPRFKRGLANGSRVMLKYTQA